MGNTTSATTPSGPPTGSEILFTTDYPSTHPPGERGGGGAPVAIRPGRGLPVHPREPLGVPAGHHPTAGHLAGRGPPSVDAQSGAAEADRLQSGRRQRRLLPRRPEDRFRVQPKRREQHLGLRQRRDERGPAHDLRGPNRHAPLVARRPPTGLRLDRGGGLEPLCHRRRWRGAAQTHVGAFRGERRDLVSRWAVHLLRFESERQQADLEDPLRGRPGGPGHTGRSASTPRNPGTAATSTTRTADSTGIWRVPVAGGEEAEVVRGPVSGGTTGLSPGAASTTRRPARRSRQRVHDPVSRLRVRAGPQRCFARSALQAHRWLAVSPDEEWILYSELPEAQSELMLVENFR